MLEVMAFRKNLELPRVNPRPITAAYYPDFTGGVCTTPRGIETARTGASTEISLRAIKARARAKALCNVGPCPIRDMCRSWVLSQEDPPGSWGGVWGGLDPWNRRGLELIIRDGKAQVISYDVIDKRGTTEPAPADLP